MLDKKEIYENMKELVEVPGISGTDAEKAVAFKIEEMLKDVPEASSEYQFMLDHLFGRDECTLFVEINTGVDKKQAETAIQKAFKEKIGIFVHVKPVAIGDLPRSEKKSTRIFDNRY